MDTTQALTARSNPTAERALIGCMLLDHETALQISAQLTADDFFSDNEAQTAFIRLSEYLKTGKPLDPIILFKQGILTQNQLASFIEQAPTAQNWKHYAGIVREARQWRAVFLACCKFFRNGYSKENADFTENAGELMAAVRRACRDSLTTEKSLNQIMNEAADKASTAGTATAKTGVSDFDNYALNGGIDQGQSAAIIGGEGSLKTALALSIVEDYITRVQKPVLYLSLDMLPEQVGYRRISRISDLSLRELSDIQRTDRPYFDKLIEYRAQIDNGLFHVIGGSCTLSDIERAISQIQPGLIILDYLTCITGFETPYETQRAFCEAFRRWREYSPASWVILSQMSQAAKTGQRNGYFTGSPNGGGELVQLVDVAIELFKDKPRDPTEYEIVNHIFPQPPLIAIITKNRNGASGQQWELEYNGKNGTILNAHRVTQKSGNARAVFERFNK